MHYEVTLIVCVFVTVGTTSESDPDNKQVNLMSECALRSVQQFQKDTKITTKEFLESVNVRYSTTVNAIVVWCACGRGAVRSGEGDQQGRAERCMRWRHGTTHGNAMGPGDRHEH